MSRPPVRLAALLGALAPCVGALALVTSAAANQYPPGPSGCCPDSVTIMNIQNPVGTPHPVPPDTVLGVRGIITGFDAKPTGFGFYLQSAGPSQYAGVFVFTAGTNKGPSTLADFHIGDSLVVYGRVIEFSGGTEIEGPDGGFSTDDLVCHRFTAGNALPAVHVGTLSELAEPVTNTGAERFEGMLVMLPGPLRVARNSNTGGLGTANSFLLVDPFCPGPSCDSVFVDGNTLTTVAPPNVGAIVDSVRGLYDQRTRGYRIQLRDGNDLAIAAPPTVLDAFPIFDNGLPGNSRVDSIMVVFDRAVQQSSAENTANYTLGSFGTVDGAHRLSAPADNRVVLQIRNGLDDGAQESVTVSNVVALGSGLPMLNFQSLYFFNGVLSISNIRAPNPDSLLGPLCTDRSRYSGPAGFPGGRLSVKGTTTAVFGANSALQDSAGPRCGVDVFAPIVSLVPGHTYLFVGAVQEFQGLTEVTSNAYVRDFGTGVSFSPLVRSIAVLADSSCDSLQVSATGEDYESVLVGVDKVVITADGWAPGGFWVARPGAPLGPELVIGQLAGNFTYTPVAGHIVTVSGILGASGRTHIIYPRNDADIVDFGTAAIPSVPASISNSATASRDPGVVLADNVLFMAWGRVGDQVAFSRSLDDGSSWSLPKPMPQQGSEPALAVAEAAKICVLTAGPDSLRFFQSVDGGFQMTPVVATVDHSPTEFPALAVGGIGHIHAAWERSQTGVFYGRSLNSGTSFSTPQPLALDNWPTNRNSLVRICASPGDSVYVLWEYQKTGLPANNRIMLSRSFDGGLSFLPPKVISDTTKYAVLGDAHVDASGALYVLRMQSGPTDSTAFLRSTNGGATFSTIGRPPSPAPTGTCPKSFVLGSSGLVYAILGICSTDLFYTRSTNGGVNWDPLVNFTNGQGAIGEPRGARIILDAHGKPIVVWFGFVAGAPETYIGRIIN